MGNVAPVFSIRVSSFDPGQLSHRCSARGEAHACVSSSPSALLLALDLSAPGWTLRITHSVRIAHN